jgi:CelD/BcsL family acetyltransferase involved in cellulose biosynthesis
MAVASAGEVEHIELGAGWRARIYRDWSATAAIASAWDALAAGRGDAGIFLEHGWFEQWWSAFATDAGPFVIALVRGDAIAAILPACLTRHPSGGTALLSMTSEAPYDVLAAPEWRLDAMRQLVDLLPRLGRVFPVRIEDFAGSSENRARLEELLSEKRVPFDCYRERHSPFIDATATSWEQYMDGLHSKLKNNLRKGRRRAEKTGTLSFEVVERTDALDALMTDAFDVESQSWKGEHGSAMKADPRKERFYRGIASWAMQRGRLHLCVLRLDGRMVAFDLCLAGGRTLFALKTGYDASAAGAYSPGNLMRFEVIKRVFDDARFDRYDFLGRCYPWKLEWTAAADERTTFEVFEPNLRGRLAYLGRHGWKRPFKSSPMLAAIRERVAHLRTR